MSDMTELERKKKRLDMYYQMEEDILSGKPISYGIGSRNKTRFNVTIEEVRKMIERLEDEIASMEKGRKRKAVAVVPVDH